MKKKLPKALLWTADDMRVAGSASPQQPESMRPPDLSEPKSGTPTGAPAGEIIELPRLPDPRPAVIANANLQPTVTPADQYWARRRRLRATTVVERHANFSAVGGVIPIPIANVAAVTAMIVRMVRSSERPLWRAVRARSRPHHRDRADGWSGSDRLCGGHDIDPCLRRAGQQSPGAGRVIDHRSGLHPQYRAVLRGAFRERGNAGAIPDGWSALTLLS